MSSYEFVLSSPAEPMSYSSFLKGLRNDTQLYSSCFVEFCVKDLFKTTTFIFVYFPWSLFCEHFTRFRSYSSINKDTVLKISGFIVSESWFFMIDNLSIAIHTSTMHMLSSLSVYGIWLSRYFSENHPDFPKTFPVGYEKQGIINLYYTCHSRKNYASIVLSESKATFLGEEWDASISLLRFIYTALPKKRMSSNVLVSYTSGRVSLRTAMYQVLPLSTDQVWYLVNH